MPRYNPPKILDEEYLLESANDSARHFRNVYLAYLTVMIYIFVIVLSTEQELLFRAGDKQLPLIHIRVPIVEFFTWMPWALLVLHFYLLIQVRFLSDKVRLYKQEINNHLRSRDTRKAKMLLAPVPLVHILVEEKAKFKQHKMLYLIVFVSLVVFPLIVLITAQIAFLPYQSELITWFHRIVILIDIFLLWYFWRNILRSHKGKTIWINSLAGLLVVLVPVFVVIVVFINFPSSKIHNNFTASFYKSEWVKKIMPTNYFDLLDRKLVKKEPAPELLAAHIIEQMGNETLIEPGSPIWCHYADSLDLKGRNFRKAQLRDATLCEAILPNTDFTDANIENASLISANLRGANLTSADLRGANLTSADLRGANLTSAYLVYANLTDADLEEANLTYAYLEEADLTSADLLEANLTSAYLEEANLTDADLEEANLTDADLVYANLTSADLGSANLTDAYLGSANLTDAYLGSANLTFAELGGADLTSADLLEANLTDADLRGANLTDAYLREANLTSAYLREANLTDADLREANLTDADLQGANLTSAYLGSANLTDAYLGSANLTFAELGGADLTDADLREANLTDAYLREANLTDADLLEANLTSADLPEANLTDADLREANLTSAYLREANLTDADLREANLTDAYLWEANLTDADLRDANLTSATLIFSDLTAANLSRTDFSNAILDEAILDLTWVQESPDSDEEANFPTGIPKGRSDTLKPEYLCPRNFVTSNYYDISEYINKDGEVEQERLKDQLKEVIGENCKRYEP